MPQHRVASDSWTSEGTSTCTEVCTPRSQQRRRLTDNAPPGSIPESKAEGQEPDDQEGGLLCGVIFHVFWFTQRPLCSQRPLWCFPHTPLRTIRLFLDRATEGSFGISPLHDSPPPPPSVDSPPPPPPRLHSPGVVCVPRKSTALKAPKKIRARWSCSGKVRFGCSGDSPSGGGGGGVGTRPRY